MPSYYNHNNRSDKVQEEDIDLNTKEIKKIKVKHAKTMTNKTRLRIAEDLQCSVRYVDELWSEVKKEEAYKLETKVDSEIRRQIRQYELMNIELFEAWELSKNSLRKKSITEGHNAKGQVKMKKMAEEDRLPDPRYLEMIQKNNKEIANLLSITKHVEINLNQQNNEINVFGDSFKKLIPDEHNDFIKKPDTLPAGDFTSIEDTDEFEDITGEDENDIPESIDG